MAREILRMSDPTIDVFALEEGLLKNPESQICVRQITTGQTFVLCLNRERQLCYLDGKSKRLFPRDARGFMPVENPQTNTEQNADRGYLLSSTDELASGPLSVPPSNMEILQMVNTINTIIDGLARPPVHVAPPCSSREATEREFLEELTTTFRVVVPPYYEVEKLAIQYVLAITKSITDLKTKYVPKTKYDVGKYVTQGFIKDIPGLLPLIEEALEEAGIDYGSAPTTSSYVRFTAWMD